MILGKWRLKLETLNLNASNASNANAHPHNLLELDPNNSFNLQAPNWTRALCLEPYRHPGHYHPGINLISIIHENLHSTWLMSLDQVQFYSN